MNLSRRLGVVAVVALLTLGACSTVSKVGALNPFHRSGKEKARSAAAARSNRVPVIALNDQLKVADALKGQDFLLPPPAPQSDWPVPGGTLEQSVENVD